MSDTMAIIVITSSAFAMVFASVVFILVCVLIGLVLSGDRIGMRLAPVSMSPKLNEFALQSSASVECFHKLSLPDARTLSVRTM
jgi:hypothetical protein